MANRIGRPRKNPIDRNELIGIFSRQTEDERDRLLDIFAGIHEGLKAKAEPELSKSGQEQEKQA